MRPFILPHHFPGSPLEPTYALAFSALLCLWDIQLSFILSRWRRLKQIKQLTCFPFYNFLTALPGESLISPTRCSLILSKWLYCLGDKNKTIRPPWELIYCQSSYIWVIHFKPVILLLALDQNSLQILVKVQAKLLQESNDCLYTQNKVCDLSGRNRTLSFKNEIHTLCRQCP